jgi:SAM-dependent methyltransferase
MPRPNDEFMQEMAALEDTYLASDDPIAQSGFDGGAARWRAEREPILTAVDRDGDFLDVGCANGYLLESLIGWAAEEGIDLVPHGIDLGSRLIETARQRMPAHAAHLHHADMWTWHPPRTYDYVYTLADLAPPGLLGDLCRRLQSWVTPGGRLIIGDYGSHSRGLAPQDMQMVLKSLGFEVAGAAVGGDPIITAFAWVDC